MRTPRRNFVVEYKTNRRPKAGPASIWGNLDLQAVARAVEIDGALPAIAQEDAIAAETQSNVIEDVGHDVLSGSTTLAENAQSPTDAERINIAESSLTEGEPSLAPAEEPRPRRRARRWSEPVVNVADQSGGKDLANSEDELAALEAENRHLKHLLGVRLREENKRLHAMLRRFGGSS
ncbi:hypothetical protein J2046_005667 [Rhizobium petrolearium]|nr:hypothetical protein [Neorhizobium petrolearium]